MAEITKDCAHCGASFSYPSRPGRPQIYCGAECRRQGNYNYSAVVLTEKTCEYCGDSFMPKRKTTEKYCSHNCTKYAWVSRHPEQRKAIANVRRAKKKGVPADGLAPRRTPCVYCGAPSEEIDHVVPIAKGGWDVVENKVWSCASCNRGLGGKFDKYLEEWRPGNAVRVN